MAKKMKKKDRLLKSKKPEFTRKIKLFAFVETINLYLRLLVDKYTKGVTDVPDRPVEDGKFYYSTNRIFTKDMVKKMYFIHDLPDILPRGFVSDLRADVQKQIRNYNQTNNLDEKLHVNFNIYAENYNFDKSDRRVQGKWRHFTREFEKVQAKAGEKTLQDELKSDKYAEQIRRKVNSFLYIKEATEEQDASLYKSTMTLELCGSSNEALAVAEDCIERFTFKHRIKIKDVFIQTNNYQKAFTPCSVDNTVLLKQMVSSDVLADDTLSSFTLTTHGKVGDEIGIYHGVDVFSREVVSFDFSKGSDSHNILLTASSGEGKSNYAKMLYTFITAMTETYSTIIFDYEGVDYLALGKVTDAKFVSFSGSSGSYVNTMAIGDLTGDDLIDEGLIDESREATKRVFDLLVDENHGMDNTQVAVFSEALKNLYEKNGVFDKDKSTWHKSKNLTYYMLYSTISKMKDETKYIQEFSADTLYDLTIALKPYFEDGQFRTKWFSNPITVQELIDSQNIIFNFGMYGKDESTNDLKAIALKQIFASYLTMLLAGRNKSKGIRTVVFIEEMQRYLKQVYSGQIINGIASGGRKLGIIAYFITNSPDDLMDMETSDISHTGSKEDNVASLLSNLNYQIIGAINRPTMLKLINRFRLHDSANYLLKLAEIKENKQKVADLKYCFHISYKGQSTLVRMLIHPDLEKLPLYSTLSDSKVTSDDIKEKNAVGFNIGDKELNDILDESIKKEKEMMKNKVSWYERLSKMDTKMRDLWERTSDKIDED